MSHTVVIGFFEIELQGRLLAYRVVKWLLFQLRTHRRIIVILRVGYSFPVSDLPSIDIRGLL